MLAMTIVDIFYVGSGYAGLGCHVAGIQNQHKFDLYHDFTDNPFQYGRFPDNKFCSGHHEREPGATPGLARSGNWERTPP